MSAQGQLEWAKRFAEYKDGIDLIEEYHKSGKQTPWTADMSRTLLSVTAMMVAFQPLKSFAEQVARDGRTEPFARVFAQNIALIRKLLTQDRLMQDANGNQYMYIPALIRPKKRGRPSETDLTEIERMQQERDADVRKTKVLADMLGLKVITDEPKREKNNEELAAERAQREAEERAKNPTLFGNTIKAETEQAAPQELLDDVEQIVKDEFKKACGRVDARNKTNAQEEKQQNTDSGINDADNKNAAPFDPSASLSLRQLRLYLSPELAEATEKVRDLRAEASAAAERAKQMADDGRPADEIAAVAKQSQEAYEQYQHIFELVDEEMATLYARLKDDVAYYTDGDGKKFNREPTMEIAKPYWIKADQELRARIMRMIDENNPEKVAERERQAKIKKEADDIIKYLRRRDKKSTQKRLDGMTEKMKRLHELIGPDADAYQPFVEKCREEVKASKK